ncbi:hypothetical protein [Serratia sp. Se-RSBMAAmG]|nr:hypothetical protein [Serratia sp. Se-RSBMAAmG]MDI6976051.1 hypothetical protein [Serratia sp. Se-RSBMAAmG]
MGAGTVLAVLLLLMVVAMPFFITMMGGTKDKPKSFEKEYNPLDHM